MIECVLLFVSFLIGVFLPHCTFWLFSGNLPGSFREFLMAPINFPLKFLAKVAQGAVGRVGILLGFVIPVVLFVFAVSLLVSYLFMIPLYSCIIGISCSGVYVLWGMLSHITFSSEEKGRRIRRSVNFFMVLYSLVQILVGVYQGVMGL